MTRVTLVLSVTVALLGASRPAVAEDLCGDRSPRPDGPVAVGLLDGQLATAHRACPRTEVTLAGDGYVVADTANFYGNIRVDGVLSGSWAITEMTEVFASMGLVRYQTVIASVAAAYLGTGYLSLGAAHRLLTWEDGTFALTGRLVLPTASGLDANSVPLGGDVGVTTTWAPHPTVDLHGALVLGGSLGISAAPPSPRGTARLFAAVDWHPLRWLGLAFELGAGFGYRGALDMLAGSLAFRFGIVSGLGVELAATYPFIGEERALLAGFLRLSWRFPGPATADLGGDEVDIVDPSQSEADAESEDMDAGADDPMATEVTPPASAEEPVDDAAEPSDPPGDGDLPVEAGEGEAPEEAVAGPSLGDPALAESADP